jgi:hypothetical protein
VNFIISRIVNPSSILLQCGDPGPSAKRSAVADRDPAPPAAGFPRVSAKCRPRWWRARADIDICGAFQFF